MRHVYGFATVNIVAGQSRSPEDGLFNPREPFLFDSFTVRSQWEDQPEVDYLYWDNSGLDDDFEFAPLTKRGWVFQERLLAPRILQFGKKQVYWRCSELFACETWPLGVCSWEGYSLRLGPDLDGLDDDSPMEIQPLQDTSHTFLLFLPTDPVVRWEKLVSQYSCTELTNPEDKLVALSGVAELFQQTFGNRYLAGLWFKWLERLLCWRRDLEKEPKPRVKPKYRAPSWSWASIDGPICFTTTTTRQKPMLWLEYLVRGVEAEVVYDEMAQIKSGYIMVKASLRSIKITTIRSKDGSEEGLKAEVGGKEFDDYFWVVIDTALDSELDDLTLWVIPTLIFVGKEHFDAPVYVLEGLLLRESAVERDAYERIGYFTYYASSPYVGDFEEFGIFVYQDDLDSTDDSGSPDDPTLLIPGSFSVKFDQEIDLWPTVTIV